MIANNLNLRIHSQQIIRSPHFSIQENLDDNKETLTQLIKEASPEFYSVIEDIGTPRTERNTSKVNYAVWKYFNRAKYRAVPFGGFASVAITPATDVGVSELTILKDDMVEHLFNDWDNREQFICHGKDLIKEASYFITNATVYSTAESIRFIVTNKGQFEIDVVEQFEELRFLCDYCRTAQNKASIFDHMGSRFNLKTDSIKRLLIQLTDSQILLTDNYPNIVGEDYFKRRGQNVVKVDEAVYRITERKCVSGPSTPNLLNEMNGLIVFLNNHLPYTTNPDLDNFKSAFIKRFDKQFVPLSIALDPELGIGYAALETGINSLGNKKFSEIFHVADERYSSVKFNPLMSFILSRCIESLIVDLDDFIPHEKVNPPQLPNSFSMLYHKWNGHTVVQNIGGCTANALIGRFTLCGGEIESFGRLIAEKEQQANPDSVFFDVSYQAEKHVDNVNRRKNIYQHELPLFNWCNSVNSLSLEDISVSVRGNEIILFSEKLGKRLVPRIPTAYNYTRSDLSVYRFLSDLQHQSIRSDMSLPLRKYIPGLTHYPRIIYKKVILSPEMWLLDKELVKSIVKNDLESGISIISTWLKDQRINAYFSVGKGDQTLIFDAKQKEEMIFFYHYCKQNKNADLYLSEAFVNDQTGIQNESGKQYNGQFLASFYHENEVYKIDLKKTDSNICLSSDVTRRNAPGSEWLYFEIYSHPSRVNDLLLPKIKAVLKEAKSMIKRWFFVRYRENGFHIRFRLELKESKYVSNIINMTSRLLKDDLQSGLVSDLQIKTYVREIERYAIVGFIPVEHFFYADSKYALGLIGISNMDNLYQLTLDVMRRFVESTFELPVDQLSFVTTTAELFSKEFAFDRNSFKNINCHYEKFRRNHRIDEGIRTSVLELTKSYQRLIADCRNQSELRVLLTDILHMHINRIYSNDNRKHEAILYQYLLKDMKRCQKNLKLIAE